MIQDNQQMLRKKDDLNRKRCSPVLLELLLVYILSSFLQIKQQTYFTIFRIVTVVLQVTTLPLTPCPVKDIVVFLAEKLFKSRIFHCF